jgi:hypothetical protein
MLSLENFDKMLPGRAQTATFCAEKMYALSANRLFFTQFWGARHRQAQKCGNTCGNAEDTSARQWGLFTLKAPRSCSI